MDPLTFFSETLKCLAGLAWPVTVIVLAFVFRQPILRLLNEHDIESLQAGPVRAQFTKRVEDLKQKAEKTLPPVESPEEGTEPINLKTLYELVGVSPQSAILMAWVMVETKLYDAARRAGYTYTIPTPIPKIIRTLVERDLIPESLIPILNDLRGLRNTAAHRADFDVTEGQAVDYIHLASRTAAALDSVASNIDANKQM